MNHLGVVAIGRNEGTRLATCLESSLGTGRTVVYVDSGSTDGSVAVAKRLGVDVVELDPHLPFTAARARNEGFARLMQLAPSTRYVQFLDADCEMAQGWPAAAEQALSADPKLAAVCGRLRERHPEASIYNRLCDLEWNGPLGSLSACGGNALLRADRFAAVGGYDPTVIAAEDDELCVRLRLRDWQIVRIAQDMAWHDAAMTRFGQWWRRAVRAGHAYAQVHAMHGRGPTRHFAREMQRILAWGVALPLSIGALAWFVSGYALLLLGIYPLKAGRIWYANRRRGIGSAHAWLHAMACVAAVFPHALGAAKFAWHRLWRRQSTIIEHKHAASAPAEAARSKA